MAYKDTNSLSRRGLLQAGGVTAVFALSGCANSGTPSGENGQSNELGIETDEQSLVVPISDFENIEQVALVSPGGELHQKVDVTSGVSAVEINLRGYDPGEHNLNLLGAEDQVVYSTTVALEPSLRVEEILPTYGMSDQRFRQLYSQGVIGIRDHDFIIRLSNAGTAFTTVKGLQVVGESDLIESNANRPKRIRDRKTINPNESETVMTYATVIGVAAEYGRLPKSGSFKITIITSHGPDIEVSGTLVLQDTQSTPNVDGEADEAVVNDLSITRS